MSTPYLLGIDAGTTVIKSTLFDVDGREVAGAVRDSSLLSPRPGLGRSRYGCCLARRGCHSAPNVGHLRHFARRRWPPSA